MILDIFLVFLCVFLLLSCVFWAYLLIFVFWYKVPLISTHKSVVKAMVELAEIKPKDRVYDLGCGFAPMLFQSAQLVPQAQYYGVEVLRPIVWFNRLRAARIKPSIKFIKSNFFKIDLVDADVIFCYLWDTIMDDIYVKIWPHLKSGAKIVSHDFPLKKLSPVKTLKINRSTVYVYVKP